ncbi:MAG: DUF4258 domain-containing protein [Bacteriovoracaceae bacterium]|jgi:hypothetical protein|nr:DUF4258 domain-containing protein [Bacteriovoracaceae bacterium]
MFNIKQILLIFVVIFSYAFKDKVLEKESFEIVLTKHAKCRMGCRKIDLDEIKEIISLNKINYKKSNKDSKPCPTISYEGFSKRDKQNIRIVTASCKKILKIITVIDLKKKYQCNCK